MMKHGEFSWYVMFFFMTLALADTSCSGLGRAGLESLKPSAESCTDLRRKQNDGRAMFLNAFHVSLLVSSA